MKVIEGNKVRLTLSEYANVLTKYVRDNLPEDKSLNASLLVSVDIVEAQENTATVASGSKQVDITFSRALKTK